MNHPFAIRLLAMAATALTLAAVRGSTEQWFIYAIGFVHYTLAVFYSGRQLREAVSAPADVLALAGLVALSAALYLGSFSIVAYFGLHHAFNEAYIRPAARNDRLRPAAFALQLAAYAVVIRNGHGMVWIDPGVLAAVPAASLVWYATRLRTIDYSAKIDTASPEIASLLLVVASAFVRFEFLDFVLYHFVLWSLLPLSSLAARGSRSLAIYATATLATLAAVLTVAPLSAAPWPVRPSIYHAAFMVLSYTHITLSFALSDSHPQWIVRMFRGGSEARA